MERRDYLLKEIEKISQIIMALANKIFGIDSSNASSIIAEVNQSLNEQLDLDIKQLIELTEEDILEKISRLNHQNIEDLLELILALIKSLDKQKKEFYKLKKLSQRALFLIDYLNNNTKAYSIKRTSLEKQFQEWLLVLN